MITKYIQKFFWAFNGVWYALTTDRSYQIQVIGGALFFGSAAYLAHPLTQTEILFLALGWILVLITEL